MPTTIIARPTTSIASPPWPNAAILSKLSCSCLAVDERRAEQQRRRADGADDQVLEPCFERADQVDVDRTHHVEADREPLERQEESHQVGRGDEERHPGRGGGQQGVELGHVLVAPALAVRDEDRDRSRGCDQDLGECAPAVAVHRIVHEYRRERALHVEHDCEDERGDEAGEADERSDDLPDRPPREDGDHQQDCPTRRAARGSARARTSRCAA